MDQHLEIVLQKWSALLVHIRSEKTVRPAHDSPVGTFDPFAARAHGTEVVIFPVVFVDICSLECCPGHQLRLGTGLDREAVLREFNPIYTPETSPEKVFMSVLLNVEWVNAVLDTYFIAPEQLALVDERSFRPVCHSAAYTAGPFPSPDRH